MNELDIVRSALNVPLLSSFMQKVTGFITAYIVNPVRLGELGAILFAFLLALILAPRLRRLTANLSRFRTLPKPLADLFAQARVVALPALWLLLQWLTLIAAQQIVAKHPELIATAKQIAAAAAKGQPIAYSGGLILVAVNLLGAWVILRLASRLIRATMWSNLVFALVWVVVALNVLGLLDPLIAALDEYAVSFGNVRISIYTILKGMASLAILLWAASVTSRFLAERIRHIEEFTPSIQVLLTKLLQFVLVMIAVVLALSVVGIDLTALTVFSGAIGIGIGLGLQNAASNIASGFMLLLDKSVKPGDIVSVGDTFGWVTSLGGRYVSIRTRDGIEHLIPNEHFISKGVENWSFNDRAVRLKIPVGVAYDTDLHLAQKLCVEAAKACKRVLDYPEAACLLMGFGDSAVSLELRVWIADPENGVSNAKSEILFNVWDKFREAKVQIPFPQRVLHMSPHALAALEPLRGQTPPS